MKTIKLSKSQISWINLLTGKLENQMTHQQSNTEITSQLIRLSALEAAELSNECFEAGLTGLAITLIRL